MFQLLVSLKWLIHPTPFLLKVRRPFSFLRRNTYLRDSMRNRIALDALAYSGAGWLVFKAAQAALALRGPRLEGYRVELGDVEAVVREEASVETAIALGWPETAAGADPILVFIFDGGADLDAVNTRARRRLPAYMAPRELRHIDQFALNSNGKIDRRMLRALLLAEG